MTEQSFFLADEDATVVAGACLAKALVAVVENAIVSDAALMIYLQGHLGAGKTTFCRGVLQALGHHGNVKSPTYTLVEPYDLSIGAVYHFDLYRLRDPAELEYMGAKDYFDQGSVCLVEWPSQGGNLIPRADLKISLQMKGEEEGRDLMLEGISLKGNKVVTAFSYSAK